MPLPHRQRPIARLELDSASDIEREAMLLVERVNRRIQELRNQRVQAGGRENLPGADQVDRPRDPGMESPQQQPGD